MAEGVEGVKAPPGRGCVGITPPFSRHSRPAVGLRVGSARRVCASAGRGHVGGSRPQGPAGLWSPEAAWHMGGMRDVGTGAPSRSRLASDKCRPHEARERG